MLSAYSRVKLGWYQAKNLKENGVCTLKPSSSAKSRYKVYRIKPVSRPRRNIFSSSLGILWNLTSTSPNKALLCGISMRIVRTCLLIHHLAVQVAARARACLPPSSRWSASFPDRRLSVQRQYSFGDFFILVLVLNQAIVIQTRIVGPTV